MAPNPYFSSDDDIDYDNDELHYQRQRLPIPGSPRRETVIVNQLPAFSPAMSSSSPIRSRNRSSSRVVIGSLTSLHNNRHAPSNHPDYNNDIPSMMITDTSPNSQGSDTSQSSIGSPSKRKRQRSICNTLRHLLYKIKTSRLLLISILYSLGSTMFLIKRMDYNSIDNNRGLRMLSYSRESSTIKSKYTKRRRSHPQVVQYNDRHDLLTPSIIKYMDTKERLETTTSLLSSYLYRRVEPMSKATLLYSSDKEDIHGECQQQLMDMKPHPTCNSIHEMDLGYDYQNTQYNVESERIDIGPKGESKVGWWLHHTFAQKDEELALRTSSINSWTGRSDYNSKQYSLDAIIEEQLSSSPNIINIYSSCSRSIINDYAYYSLETEYRRNRRQPDRKTRVRYARDVASGLATLHNIDDNDSGEKNNGAMAIYGKLNPGNLEIIKDHVVLSNFNDIVLLPQHGLENGRHCNDILTPPPLVGPNIHYHAPEEARGEELSEKVDIYALVSLLMDVSLLWLHYHHSSYLISLIYLLSLCIIPSG